MNDIFNLDVEYCWLFTQMFHRWLALFYLILLNYTEIQMIWFKYAKQNCLDSHSKFRYIKITSKWKLKAFSSCYFPEWNKIYPIIFQWIVKTKCSFALRFFRCLQCIRTCQETSIKCHTKILTLPLKNWK